MLCPKLRLLLISVHNLTWLVLISLNASCCMCICKLGMQGYRMDRNAVALNQNIKYICHYTVDGMVMYIFYTYRCIML